MSSIRQYDGVSEAEKTLRMIAQLPAPVGLEERVSAALKAGRPAGQVLAWPGATRSGRVGGGHPGSGFMRAAAAAAIVCVVAGGGWGIYSGVQQGQSARVVAPPHAVNSGGFSNAGAMRTPQTVVGPDAPRPASTQVKDADKTAQAAGQNGKGQNGKAPVKKLVAPSLAGANPVAQ
jgi:hypothetical protein